MVLINLYQANKQNKKTGKGGKLLLFCLLFLAEGNPVNNRCYIRSLGAKGGMGRVSQITEARMTLEN